MLFNFRFDPSMSRTHLNVSTFAALIGSAILLAGCLPVTGPSLTGPEAFQQTQKGEITLIDVRTPLEWRQTGIAEGARRVDLRHPQGPAGFADQVLAEVGGDKTAPVALICRTGNRSSQMQQELMARGFTNVYNVTGGMSGSLFTSGWVREGLPVEPCGQC
jgi:rhodanese-related sulfurtransferase